jgi:hypothetical protein
LFATANILRFIGIQYTHEKESHEQVWWLDLLGDSRESVVVCNILFWKVTLLE